MVKRFLKRRDEHDVAILAATASLQARIISGLYMVKRQVRPEGQHESRMVCGVPEQRSETAPESPLTEGHVSWAYASLPPGPKICDMPETASPLHRAVGNTQRPKEAADSPASRTSTSPPKKMVTKSSQRSKGSTIPFYADAIRVQRDEKSDSAPLKYLRLQLPCTLPRNLRPARHRNPVRDSRTDGNLKNAV